MKSWIHEPRSTGVTCATHFNHIVAKRSAYFIRVQKYIIHAWPNTNKYAKYFRIRYTVEVENGLKLERSEIISFLFTSSFLEPNKHFPNLFFRYENNSLIIPHLDFKPLFRVHSQGQANWV